MLIPPTLLHGLQYTPDVDGHILTISDSIVADIFKTSSSIWKTFEQIQILTNFEADTSFERILSIIGNIEYELFNENPERFLMLRASILQFFVCMHRSTKLDDAVGGNHLTKNYFRAFKQNIKQAIYPKTIPEFAEELHITTVHLNRICKAISGKSAIELVHQNIIIEAQKYLLHTSYSVSEIAYLLKFEYPNYFAKLFKKHVGLSPVEYRKQDRK
jgi:AraC family transcriptional activator of pobA